MDSINKLTAEGTGYTFSAESFIFIQNPGQILHLQTLQFPMQVGVLFLIHGTLYGTLSFLLGISQGSITHLLSVNSQALGRGGGKCSIITLGCNQCLLRLNFPLTSVLLKEFSYILLSSATPECCISPNISRCLIKQLLVGIWSSILS